MIMQYLLTPQLQYGLDSGATRIPWWNLARGRHGQRAHSCIRYLLLRLGEYFTQSIGLSILGELELCGGVL